MDRKTVDFAPVARALGLDPETKVSGPVEADIRDADATDANAGSNVPVATGRPLVSRLETVAYLVMFAALYDTVYNLCILSFQVIGRAMPDGNTRFLSEFSDREILWSVASLVVAFPIFMVLFRQTNNRIARDPAARKSHPRMWLGVLTVFIAAIVLMGDAIAVVNVALSGELSLRFGLKATAAAIMIGGVFAYFLDDLRKGERA